MELNHRSLIESVETLTFPDILKVLRERYKNSLFETCKYLLGMKDINPRTHGDVIDLLEDDSIKKKLIVLPRGSLKSSIASVGYPIWRLIKDPNDRIMIDSSLYSNSKNFVKEVKGHLMTELATLIFGQFETDNSWSEGEITINQRTKVLKEPSIMASGVAANKVSVHVDCIIHDDLNTEVNSRTPDLAMKVRDHYKRNISILEPGGTIVVVGTRYSANDVIASILENEMQLNLDRQSKMVSDKV